MLGLFKKTLGDQVAKNRNCEDVKKDLNSYCSRWQELEG